MTARKYRHEDGIHYKRHAVTSQSLTVTELEAWISEQLGAGSLDALVSGGVHLEWYSPMTPDEVAQAAEHKARADARQEKWERETYERLRAKFAPGEAEKR